MSERRLQACSGAVTIVNMHAALPHGDDITHVYAAEADARFELQNSRNVSGHAMVSKPLPGSGVQQIDRRALPQTC